MRHLNFIAPIRTSPKIDISDLLAEYAAKGGSVRQFKRGDSGSVDGHMIFLQERGYVLKPHNGIMFKIRGPGEKTLRAISRPALIAMIDRVRIEEGREPMRVSHQGIESEAHHRAAAVRPTLCHASKDTRISNAHDA